MKSKCDRLGRLSLGRGGVRTYCFDWNPGADDGLHEHFDLCEPGYRCENIGTARHAIAQCRLDVEGIVFLTRYSDSIDRPWAGWLDGDGL